MYIVYNSKTNETVSKFADKGDAMWDVNIRNDRYAMSLIRSGKAPEQFSGIYYFKEEE